VGINIDSFPESCVFEETGLEAVGPEWAMTRYNGRYYQHAWIRRADIARLKQGNALLLTPGPSGPGARVPLTLAVGSYATDCYSGSLRNASSPCYQDRPDGAFLLLPAGKKVALDGHAWEDFTAFPQRQYQAPAWDKEPGTFVPDKKFGSETAGFDADSQVEPLQAVPDSAPIQCSRFTLDRMLQSSAATLPRVLVDARPHLGRPWTVVKFTGRAYLRGWIAGRPAHSQLTGRKLAIFSRADTPEFVNPPAQMTVPLDTLSWRMTEGGTSPSPDFPGTVGKVVVADVRLDRHAWDKW